MDVGNTVGGSVAARTSWHSSAGVPVAEVYAVCVSSAHANRRYPFTNLLYQARMCEHYVSVHFSDLIVPEFMRDIGPFAGSGTYSRRVVLWKALYISETVP